MEFYEYDLTICIDYIRKSGEILEGIILETWKWDSNNVASIYLTGGPTHKPRNALMQNIMSYFDLATNNNTW